MSETPTPSDHEFRYIGMSERKIRLMDGYDDSVRQMVYDEAIAELMECGPGYSGGIHTVDL